jgi:hypothetical protein
MFNMESVGGRNPEILDDDVSLSSCFTSGSQIIPRITQLSSKNSIEISWLSLWTKHSNESSLSREKRSAWRGRETKGFARNWMIFKLQQATQKLDLLLHVLLRRWKKWQIHDIQSREILSQNSRISFWLYWPALIEHKSALLDYLMMIGKICRFIERAILQSQPIWRRSQLLLSRRLPQSGHYHFSESQRHYKTTLCFEFER